jgi:hypothetical protein
MFDKKGPAMHYVMILLLGISSFLSALPAFPGAQGWGADSRGGRSGVVINNRNYDTRVIHVTTLNPTAAGGLGAALAAGGPRVIVFDVSGVIDLKQTNLFVGSYCTVAGQTSPGGIAYINGGIFARPYTTTNLFQPNWQSNQDIIIRFLRGRSSTFHGGDDNFRLEYTHDAIVDHCSFDNCCDEIVDIEYAYNLSFSSCLIAESNVGCGGETNYHGFQGSNTVQISLLRCLFEHHSCRVPMVDNCYSITCPSQTGAFELVNNVLYNCQKSQTFEHNNSAPVNLVGNYCKSGPDFSYPAGAPAAWDASANNMTVHLEGNYNPAFPTLQQSSFINGGNRSASMIQPANFANATTGQQAYTDAIAKCGAIPRDSCDRRLIKEMQAGTGKWRVLSAEELNTSTLIPRDPLTFPTWTKPLDSDRDGMPDYWEITHGLNPNDSTDVKTPMNGGYDAIEVYINELADTLAQTGRWPATWIETAPARPEAGLRLAVSPNPINKGTTISFSLPDRQQAAVAVYDIRGMRVASPFEGVLASGEHAVEWDGSGINGAAAPAGTYFVKLSGQGWQAIRKVVLIR